MDQPTLTGTLSSSSSTTHQKQSEVPTSSSPGLQEDHHHGRGEPTYTSTTSPPAVSINILNNNKSNNHDHDDDDETPPPFAPLSEEQTFLVQSALHAHAQRNERKRNQLLAVLFPGLVAVVDPPSPLPGDQHPRANDAVATTTSSATATTPPPTRHLQEGDFSSSKHNNKNATAATPDLTRRKKKEPSSVGDPLLLVEQQSPFQVRSASDIKADEVAEAVAEETPPHQKKSTTDNQTEKDCDVVHRPPALGDYTTDTTTSTITDTHQHHKKQIIIISPRKNKMEEGGGDPQQQQQHQVPPSPSRRRLFLPQLCNEEDDSSPKIPQQDSNGIASATIIGLPQFTKEHTPQQQQQHKPNPVIVVGKDGATLENLPIRQPPPPPPALPEPQEGNERSMLHAISAVFSVLGDSTLSPFVATTYGPLSPYHHSGSVAKEGSGRLNETTPGPPLLLCNLSSTSLSPGSGSVLVQSSPLLRRIDERTNSHHQQKDDDDSCNARSTSSVFSMADATCDGGEKGDDAPSQSSTANSSSPFVHRTVRQTQFKGKWCLNDRFVFVKRIGKGGQGSVWKALDLARSTPTHEHFVAIKIVRRNKFEKKGSTTARASPVHATGALNGDPKEPVCRSVPHTPPLPPSCLSPNTTTSTTDAGRGTPYSHRVQLLVEAYRCPAAAVKGEEEEPQRTGKDDDGDTPQSPPPPTTPATKKNGEEISLTLVAETLVGLLRHENLLGLEEIIDDPSKSEYVFLVTRLLNPPPCTICAQGRTKEGALRPTTVARYALDLAKALEQLHSCGIVHCDVKPDNFLRDDNDHLVLADFGLSRVGDEQYTVIGGGNGTVAFWAPELYHSARARKRIPHSPASDCFALGVCLYIMLHGAMPYWTDDVQNPREWRRANPCCSAKGQRSLPQPPGPPPPSLLNEKERRAFVFVAQAIDRLTQTDPKQRLDAAALARSAAEVGC